MSQRLPLLWSAARFVRRSLPICATTLLMALIALLVWSRMVTPAETSARFALDSDEAVLVSRDPWITFQPRDVDPVAGVIFYPGARAEPAAYAPILHALAARGFLVVMTPMPLNLAILAPERAGRVMARFSGIRCWIVAGHGLGGAAAATFAARHEHELAGLMLWAAAPGAFSDLSNSGIAVLSVFATGDAFTTPAEIERSRKHLPSTTRYVPIEGGDHWGFGNFAIERRTELISREIQKSLILDAAQSFLERLSAAPGIPDGT